MTLVGSYTRLHERRREGRKEKGKDEEKGFLLEITQFTVFG